MSDVVLSKELEKSAFGIYRETSKNYNVTREMMLVNCSDLYRIRIDSIMLLETAERFVNTISEIPKELKINLKVKDEIKRFRETETYLKNLNNEVKEEFRKKLQMLILSYEEIDIVNIVTVFGKIATGAAINFLLSHGIPQKTSSLLWCDDVRMSGGVVPLDEKNITEKLVVWVLAGPVRTAVPRPIAISRRLKVILWLKKRQIAYQMIEETKKMMVAKDIMDEVSEKISVLNKETQTLKEDVAKQFSLISPYWNTNYATLGQDKVSILETMINRMVSLASIINTAID